MYDLLMGGPGENKKTLQRTIELMKKVNPHRVGVTIGVRIYPGTPLASSILEAGPLSNNTHLQGEVFKEDFFSPTFYLSSELSDEIFPYLEKLIGDDERFFLPKGAGKDASYNYNQNTFLIKAIKEGYRGAYWDILRKLGV